MINNLGNRYLQFEKLLHTLSVQIGSKKFKNKTIESFVIRNFEISKNRSFYISSFQILVFQIEEIGEIFYFLIF